jgi:hypothetical protein
MTTAKPDKVSWAKRFRELLAGHLNALSERNINITSAQRAIIRSATTMEIELETMSRRFAIRAVGASAADLTLYAKISAAMQGMFESVGLGHQATATINHHVAVRVEDDGREAYAKIEAALTRLIAARREKEAETPGLIIDHVPIDPEPVAVDRVAEEDREAPVNVVHLRAPETPSVDRPKTTTELYSENLSERPYWGPIGSGGKPP